MSINIDTSDAINNCCIIPIIFKNDVVTVKHNRIVNFVIGFINERPLHSFIWLLPIDSAVYLYTIINFRMNNMVKHNMTTIYNKIRTAADIVQI